MAKRRPVDPLQQLAASVLARETTEFPWTILRGAYFTAKWDRAAARHLAQWADKYRIRVRAERRVAGSNTSVGRFTLVPAPPDKLT
jgi:hypothetical protein